MVAHAEFLRPFWESDEEDLVRMVRVMHRLGGEAAALPLEEGVRLAVAAVDESLAGIASLDAADLAILRFTVRATLSPRSLNRDYLAPMREVGLNDREIHDVANVICCFSYMNRLADTLGVALMEERYEWAERLTSREAVEEHIAWGRPTA